MEEVKVAEKEPEGEGEAKTSEDESSEEEPVRLVDSSEEEKQADTDSLKDFIVEDEEQKEGKEEEEGVETDEKSFRSHLPRECKVSCIYVYIHLVICLRF